jgi:polysaccharide biosynthesis protein PslG
VTSTTISPISASSTTDGTIQFRAAVLGTASNKSVTWKASLGTITASGIYTAPANVGTALVTATSSADPSKSASATVVIATASAPGSTAEVTSIVISPSSASSITTGTLPFTAQVQGTAADKSVRWTASSGSISPSGAYTAPATAGTVTVIATSNADPTKSASAFVTVRATSSPAPVIQTLNATPPTVQVGQPALIQWKVIGASSLELSGVGTVSANSVNVVPQRTTTYTLTAKNAAGSVSQNVTVSVATPGHPFEMGVVTHFGQNKGNISANLNLIQQMGATSIRDEVQWSTVEHQKGQYVMPTGTETFVNASLARGVRPLLTLAYGNPLYDNGNKPTSDAAIEGFAKYAEFVVSQLKGRVSLYEIWNEWDGSVGNTTPGTAESYVKLLKVVYPRLKAIDPNAIIVGGAVSGGAISGSWFNQMLAAGALSASDAISVHQYIYSSHGTPEILINKLAAIENTLRSHNANQDFPLYLTETGWPTTVGTSAVQFGDFNAETVLLAGSLSFLKGIWWYDFQDDGTQASNVEDNFGLVRADLTPKPGYYALTAVMGWIGGAEFAGRLTTSDPAVDGVQFRLSNGQQGIATWIQGTGSNQVQLSGASLIQTLPVSASSALSTLASDPQMLDVTEAVAWITGNNLQLH